MSEELNRSGTSSPLVAPGPIAASAALLDVKQVAAMLGCSPRHVYRLADAGKMPASVRIGSLVRWQKDKLDHWIAGGCLPVRANFGRRVA